MKNPLLLIAFLFVSTCGMSQEITSQKEAGISLSDFDSFGLFYRVGKPNALWRFNSVFGSVYSNENKSDNTTQSSGQLSLGVSAGREYRRRLADGLEGRLGFDVSFSYSSYKYQNEYHELGYSDISETKTFSPGVNGVFGLNYVVKQKLILGAELVPGFYYQSGKRTTEVNGGDEQKEDITGASFSLNNLARLTIGYRF